MSSSALFAIVLAAGEGTRMRSSRPKPLHLLCGRPMLMHVLDSLTTCGTDRVVVVVGHGAERVTRKLRTAAPDLSLDFVTQHEQRGTGDAVSVGLTAVPDAYTDIDTGNDTDSDSDSDLSSDGGDGADGGPSDGDVLVLPGDTPLLRPETMLRLVEEHRSSGAACTLLTARLEDPTGYGRIVRGADGGVERIVEHGDATSDERAIDEVCTSIYCFRSSVLAPALRRLTPDNAQGEYYLTDVVGVLHDAGFAVRSVIADDPVETQGVNDRLQLADAEAVLRGRINDRWLRHGVTIVDPTGTYLDATVRLESDVTLFPGTMLQGNCVVGAGAQLGPDTRLVDTVVGENAVVTATTAVGAEIGDGANVGPYAVLGDGDVVPSGVRTGPFYTSDPAT